MSLTYACSCTGRNGSPKASYPSEREAKSAAVESKRHRGIDLRVYRCPDGHVWHLTKKLVHW